jgi:hypothetical protein
MKKQFFLLAISLGVICLPPISNNSARACDKNTFTCVVKVIAPVNISSDTDEDYYSSSTMIYPLNHF